MNNGFTERAQEALRLAHQLVQQKRHSQLDVEHILLALLKPRDGVVSQLIVASGGDPALLEGLLNIDKDRIYTALREQSSVAENSVQGRLDRMSRLAHELQLEITALRRDLAERPVTDNVE